MAPVVAGEELVISRFSYPLTLSLFCIFCSFALLFHVSFLCFLLLIFHRLVSPVHLVLSFCLLFRVFSALAMLVSFTFHFLIFFLVFLSSFFLISSLYFLLLHPFSFYFPLFPFSPFALLLLPSSPPYFLVHILLSQFKDRVDDLAHHHVSPLLSLQSCPASNSVGSE